MILGVRGQLSKLSGEEMGAVLVCMRQSIDRLELEFAELAAAFAATDEWEQQGSVSPIHWLRYNCKMAGGAAADRICVGEQVAALPHSAEALADGRIGFAHLALLARTQEAVAGNGRSLDEGRLLVEAQRLSVKQFRDACHHARHAADAEGVARDEADAVEARFLELKPNEDGSLFIRGFLDSAGGAALRTALEPLARPSGRDDDRLRERRLADALVELAGHALDSGTLPNRGGQRPHLTVTASFETVKGLLGAPAAEMEFSLPISTRIVERLACDCSLTRVLLDSQSMVIDIGREQRIITGSRRRALVARDRHCRWPGCDRPAGWTNAHHLVHWIHGGSSDLNNQVLLCHRHHWMVHEGGWQLVKGESGELVTIPPQYGRGPTVSWEESPAWRPPGEVPSLLGA
jgi:hypothetical protein